MKNLVKKNEKIARPTMFNFFNFQRCDFENLMNHSGMLKCDNTKLSANLQEIVIQTTDNTTED